MNQSPASESADRGRHLHGLDYLRALMMLAVVAWHVKVFGRSDAFDPERWRGYVPELSDFLNFNFLLLAVPMFLLIAMFLVSMKAHMGPAYFRRRLKYLAILYIFWSALSIYAFHRDRETLHHLANFRNLFMFSISGGESLFYFFFSLLVLTSIAWLIRRMSTRLLWIFLGASMALVYVNSVEAILRPDRWPLVAYWNPLNFISYAFVGALLWRYWQAGSFREWTVRYCVLLALLGTAFVFLSWIEWHWLPSHASLIVNGYMLPTYTRFSLVVGATILFLLSLGIRRPAPGWIKVLSESSLGIYCLHEFVLRAEVIQRIPVPVALQFILVVGISLAAVQFVKMAMRMGIL